MKYSMQLKGKFIMKLQIGQSCILLKQKFNISDLEHKHLRIVLVVFLFLEVVVN